MATQTNEIKKALRIAFPGVKFTCKTHYDTKISWVMDLGSHVTVDAVDQIVQKFSTYSITSDPYADYMTSTGTKIVCQPEYTEERRQWAIECVLASYKNVGGHTGSHFVDLDGKYYHNAEKDCDYFLANGVTSNLFDEYGEENIEKKWYYEDLNDLNETIKTPVASTEVKEETTEITSEKTEPTTNVIKFPTTPAKNDNFYEQVYEAWVKKMVYQGQFNKIKSFEDWLAIALDILP